MEERIATVKGRIRTTPDLESVLDVVAELEAELRQVTQELELASVPRSNQLRAAQDLIAILENARDKEAVRRQIKQQIQLLVEKIVVRVEGKLRARDKRVYCMIRFKNGRERGVWFQTGSEPTDGLWSPTGRVDFDDMTIMIRRAAAEAGLDPAKAPPPLTETDWADSEVRRQYLEASGIDTSWMEYIGGTPIPR